MHEYKVIPLRFFGVLRTWWFNISDALPRIDPWGKSYISYPWKVAIHTVIADGQILIIVSNKPMQIDSIQDFQVVWISAVVRFSYVVPCRHRRETWTSKCGSFPTTTRAKPLQFLTVRHSCSVSCCGYNNLAEVVKHPDPFIWSIEYLQRHNETAWVNEHSSLSQKSLIEVTVDPFFHFLCLGGSV